MKSPVLIMLFVLLMPLVFFNCQKESIGEDSGPSDEITGSLKDYSDCKGLRSNEVDSFTQIKYVYDAANQKLNIKHINAGFNCCPDKLSASFRLSNDTLYIMEKEGGPLCHCLCLYDLDLEISAVRKQTYVIHVIEPYLGNQQALVFTIDLKNTVAGDFMLIRKNYPWGI